MFKHYEDNVQYVNNANFEAMALALFRFQAIHNKIYQSYISHLSINPINIRRIEDIPFLPITFFRNHDIKTGYWKAEHTFLSSATTHSIASRHEVKHMSFYHKTVLRTFEFFYGSPTQYRFFALLPSYAERDSASLVSMLEHLMRQSGDNQSNFYTDDFERLYRVLLACDKSPKKIMLWGVSFALLDFAAAYNVNLKHCMVMETGGMKGRREEITKQELHCFLFQRMGVQHIHTEYGMTELFSQAYAQQDGQLYTPPWMRIFIRDLYDPFTWCKRGLSGGINVVDLANVHSCAFIETQDIGRWNENGTFFEVLGRIDNADLRGCNLLVDG